MVSDGLDILKLYKYISQNVNLSITKSPFPFVEEGFFLILSSEGSIRIGTINLEFR